MTSDAKAASCQAMPFQAPNSVQRKSTAIIRTS